MQGVQAPLNGILLINKPKGLVSTRVGKVLQRKLPVARIGHLGTLDPLACGLLPILLGTATRLQDHLLDLKKTYICKIQLGIATDTLDLEGRITDEQKIVPFSEEAAQQVVVGLLGHSTQLAPLYSAVKYKGKALYKYARANQADEVERLPRNIFIYSARLLEITADSLTFEASCSKGTYIRVLAQRIASELGNIGAVSSLSRTECAGYSLSEALPFEMFEGPEPLHDDSWQKGFIAIEDVKVELPRLQMASEQCCQKLMMGQVVPLPQGFRNEFSGGGNAKGDSISSKRILIFDVQMKALALGFLSRDAVGNPAVAISRSLR